MTETEVTEAIKNKKSVMLKDILLGWIHYRCIAGVTNTEPASVILQDLNGSSFTVADPKMVRYANENEILK